MGVQPLKLNGKLESSDVSKAEILNNQFTSVFTKDSADNLPTPKPKFPSINKLFIDVQGVTKLLTNLKVNSASGPDNLPNRVLKMTADVISPVLTSIFTQSLESGQLPQDWREANVTPLFKKGDKHLAENYRPVSLTCVCCKLLEHIICKHIRSHLDKYNILTPVQHGFRSNHSCESQLILTADDILKRYNNYEQVDVVILDFSQGI